jgi:hypothetical protein
MPSWHDRAPPRRAPPDSALVEQYKAKASKLKHDADELERSVGASLALVRKKLGRIEKRLRHAEQPLRRRVAH